jgi:predicted outer membrane repeat protein
MCIALRAVVQVGGALMLHRGRTFLATTTLKGNIAAAATGSAAATAAATIYYKLGEVPTSAGGAVYAWIGSLQMNKCTVSNNVGWGAGGRGGGVFVHGASLQLADAVFERNYASSAGGAVLLGPSGTQVLTVTRSNFTGNAARQYGGAVAAGLLLPGDATAANAQALAGEAPSSWLLKIKNTQFAGNIAGKQGGALACSLCNSVSITENSFTSNAAVQTGGGISCVSCSRYTTDGCSFKSNLAASGAGACILAAGDGSTTSDNEFLHNIAGHKAAADATTRLNAAAAAAGKVAASHHGASAAGNAAIASANPMPSPRETLPACGVVGTGGGMCLGLWDAGFKLLGRNSFVDNSAVYGAGLFVEACPEGADQCPLIIDLGQLVFRDNALSDGGAASGAASARGLLQAKGNTPAVAAGAAAGLDSASWGSGADVYATNATVLVTGTRAPAAAAAVVAQPVASGRHLLQAKNANSSSSNQQQPKRKSSAGNALAVAQQLANAVTTPVRSGNGSSSTTSSSAASAASRVATGPSQLGPVQLDSSSSSSSKNLQQSRQVQFGLVAAGGKMVPVRLDVLDQLDSQVSSNVAEQLSVVAELANCTTCMVAGISKVQPSNGAAVFDSIQLLAPPGTNQSLTYTLLNATGAKLGNVQTVKVQLPTCNWGQASKIDGCSNCAYPMFTFSNPQRSNCSICPSNTRNCTGTTLLPDTGYWQSGPLSAHMIKCPRKSACKR